MNTRVTLGGESYDAGSAAHLAKIDEVDKEEIRRISSAHMKDLAERNDLEERTRLLNEEVEHGLRRQTAMAQTWRAQTRRRKSATLAFEPSRIV
jgi:hypothetical protein